MNESKPVPNPFGKVTPNSRRVVQYGFSYNYNGKTTKEENLIPIPNILCELRDLLSRGAGKRAEHSSVIKDSNSHLYEQCIINRYLPGQGISPHIDNTELFGDTIACFTFNVNESENKREMEFTKGDETCPTALGSLFRSAEKYQQTTSSGSLYLMTNSSRYEWKHAMKGKKKLPEIFSITFRQIKK